ncbi:DUF1127 domain-containing protein [Rhodobacteraceae bacterium 2376]|uniref:DUF1127 domain-containing protein n=2 Tax=Rhabdonatronobacter sediminivivens TaxID=2743469 RepID=A0A7Z0KYD7_9RHOB|nr:DUF1127 domain-containing protein [Rhabdonatronobacter sediminivivens]
MQSRPHAEGVFGVFRGFSFADIIAVFKTWNDKRITRAQLNMLSDRELDDIGLSRSDIEGVISRMS